MSECIIHVPDILEFVFWLNVVFNSKLNFQHSFFWCLYCYFQLQVLLAAAKPDIKFLVPLPRYQTSKLLLTRTKPGLVVWAKEKLIIFWILRI